MLELGAEMKMPSGVSRIVVNKFISFTVPLKEPNSMYSPLRKVPKIRRTIPDAIFPRVSFNASPTATPAAPSTAMRLAVLTPKTLRIIMTQIIMIP